MGFGYDECVTCVKRLLRRTCPNGECIQECHVIVGFCHDVGGLPPSHNVTKKTIVFWVQLLPKFVVLPHSI